VPWHLIEAGYTVELDCWDWTAGENLITRMRDALEVASRVIAVLSPAYFNDQRYTTEEWSAALVKADGGGRRLVPVQVEPCPLPLPYADTAETVRAVRAYLRGHDRWLLILDNAEAPAALRDWLPAGPGHILITSRNLGWAEMAGRVHIDVLPRPESMALLRTYRSELTATEAEQITDAVGDLPLALAQAAGFLAGGVDG
jgi:hypothetical protein